MRHVTSTVLTACLLLSPTAVLGAEERPGDVIPQPGIHVIERGDEPLQLLRYDWTVGSTESAQTDYRTSISMVQDGEEMSFSMPMSMEYEATVTDVDEDGTARIEIVYTALSISVSEVTIEGQPLDDAVLEAMTADFDRQSRQIIGSSGWEVYDSRGRLLDWGIDAPEAFPEDLREYVEEMSASPTILPEEPVGVGATWSVAQSFSETGFEIGAVEVNELLGREGDTLQLATRTELGASGEMPSSELDIAGEATVEDLAIAGDGAVTVDLGHVFAHASLHMDCHLEMSSPDGAGGTEAAIMDMEIDMEIVPV